MSGGSPYNRPMNFQHEQAERDRHDCRDAQQEKQEGQVGQSGKVGPAGQKTSTYTRYNHEGMYAQWPRAMDHPVDDQPAPERLIRISEVKTLTGLSAASIYRKITANEFPRQVSIGAMSRAWPLSEIQNWIVGRIAERDDAHDCARS